jgi:acyl-CoA thioester hydrolase
LNKHTYRIRVIYADTDAMGIVYHTNYVKWFEIGRTEMMREMGLVYAELESDQFNLPLSEAYCHYLSPARYDDILLIETAIEYVRRASLKFVYEIWDADRTRQLVEGYTVHACTNKEGKIVRFKADFMEKINRYL